MVSRSKEVLNTMIWNKYREFKNKPVAYFCAEYALFNHTPLYAGGLGILSGDYVSEIIEQKFPAVAVGLFYHHEHEFGMELSRERTTPVDLGLSLARMSDGSIAQIELEIDKQKVLVQAWIYKKAEFTLIFLDTQISENGPELWTICDTLYTNDRHLRLLQEVVLGVGGVKMLNKLNITPSIYHLNEGHSAFMTFELIRDEMELNKVDFKTAIERVKQMIVFTNHTLVGAGHELFDIDAVKNIFGEEFVSLGIDSASNMFSMTDLALKMSSKVNAVSKLHKEKAGSAWNIGNVEWVTNGVNIKNWDSLEYYSHKELKLKLIEYIKNKLEYSISEDTLIIGWARRLVEYKRPLAILGDIQRLKEIALRENRKIVIIFSASVNKYHLAENEYLRKINSLVEGDLKDILIFIPDYSVEISKLMTSGCDIWLNTPIVGQEACGTSGMKACLNGVLPLTTNDGWIFESDLKDIGWVADNEDITNSLMNILEKDIIPEFYENKEGWKKRMKNARNLILKRYSTERMLEEYIDKLYRPTYNIVKHIK